MDLVGYAVLGLRALAVLFALAFVAAPVPDIARSLRLRRM
jgi:hypothetical protein